MKDNTPIIKVRNFERKGTKFQEDYLESHPYMVVRLCLDGYWYYGVYNNLLQASEVAKEIGNGLVTLTSKVE